MATEELRSLQDLLFTDFMSRIDLRPIVTPIVESDFPGIKWTTDAVMSFPATDKETQLGFYDLQIPTSTSVARKDRPLSLILDLDQTLVHAIKLNELLGDLIPPLLPPTDGSNFATNPLTAHPPLTPFEVFVQRNFINGTCRNPNFIDAFTSRVLFNDKSIDNAKDLLVTWLEGELYLIKLRPGLRKFIADMAQLFELHIYTKANRNYLNFLINELDPLGKYFASAVARDDSPDLDVDLKVINRVCCRPNEQIVIFDDRVDIWTESMGNVIRAQPYNYLQVRKLSFVKALEEIISVSQSPNSENTAVSYDFDCHLQYMQKVLYRVCEQYTAAVKSSIPSIPGIIKSIQKSILSGMHVMFTGFTDVSSYVKEIEDYGAICVTTSNFPDESGNDISNDTSTRILVAAKHTKRVYDTKKENANVKVVHGAWLEHLRATWEVPPLPVFDYSRFRVNPDGTFVSIDNWEVVWIANHQSTVAFAKTSNGGQGSEYGYVPSAISSNDVKKRRRT